MNVWVWRPMGQLERQMGQLLDFTLDLVNQHLDPAWRTITAEAHACNLYESVDGYQILLPLPGAKSDEVDLQVVGQRLELRGDRKRPTTVADENYRRQERWFGPWSRAVELPDRADPSQVTASLENGLLLIRVPKKPEAKPRPLPVRVTHGHGSGAATLMPRSAPHDALGHT